MPRMLMLVGLPACGKSTFREMILTRAASNDALDQYAVVSSDDEVEAIAKERGITYNEVFADQKLLKRAMAVAKDKLTIALMEGKFIIADRTHMSQKSRSAMLTQALEAGYEVDAVVFARPMTNEAHDKWNHRLDNRPGKTIPDNVLIDMFTSYQRPTEEEGFANVVDVDTFA